MRYSSQNPYRHVSRAECHASLEVAAVTVISSESTTFRLVFFLGVGYIFASDVLLSPEVLGWCVISSMR